MKNIMPVARKSAFIIFSVLLIIFSSPGFFPSAASAQGLPAAKTSLDISSGQPDLLPYRPEGWVDALILSAQPGTHTNDELVNGGQNYLDLAVINAGSASAGEFQACLSVDGEQLHCWQSAGLGAGEVFTVEDWVYSANRGAGSHHFALSVDLMNSVAESDEVNNTAERDFTWLPSELDAQSIGSPLIHDVMERPELPGMQDQSATGSNLPGKYDTSTYMIGSVAVGVIMPESAGATENWTTTEQDQVVSEIQAGLARWADWSDNNDADTNLDDVDANVTFTYDIHASVPTSYEPINAADYNARCTWISDVMANMGFSSGSCFERVYAYLDSLRAAKGTTWATAIFVADSSANVEWNIPRWLFRICLLLRSDDHDDL